MIYNVDYDRERLITFVMQIGEKDPKEKSIFALKLSQLARVRNGYRYTSAVIPSRYDLSLAVFDHNCILKLTRFF